MSLPGEPTVLTHFYRGELSRMIMWRDRLDRTTNWAIISVTAIVSYSWSHPEFTHVSLLLGNAILYLLLMIEARRYLYFDAYRGRVRMLETHWLMPHLARVEPPSDHWREVLSQDLVSPAMKITLWEALGQRLARNYGWLYLILFAGWGLKIWMHGVSLKPTSAAGPAMAILIGLFYIYLVVLLVTGLRQHESSGRFQKHRAVGSGNPWTM